MNKKALVDEVAKVVGTKKEARAAVDCVLSSIIKKLKKGDDVSIAKFGTFKAVQRKPRMGRNPQTGEALLIKASRVPRFVASKTLKDALK